MADDPYEVLGVARDASQADIKKAYRKLAKTLHPDLHPGDTGKEAAFQRLGAAHDILRDSEKRARFDAGEIDASGQERARPRSYREDADADAQGRYHSSAGYGDFEDASDIFSDLFRQRRQAGAGGFSARGADRRYHLDVEFLDAVYGATRTITLPDGATLDLTIPVGLRDGQTLRLRGQGGAGLGDGPLGDAYVSITVRPHPVFRRDGDDIEIDLPIGFDEAVLGGKVEAPTLSGRVAIKVPKGASSGQRLRLKGKGVKPAGGAAGDQYVRLRIVTPRTIDAAMEDLAKQWRERVKEDPRADLWRTS